MNGIRLPLAGRILGKELREALRDRNLFINLVLVPLFLYPVLGFAMFQVFLVMRGMSEREVTVVAVDARAPGEIRDALEAEDGYRLIPLPDGWEGDGARESFRRFREEADGNLHAALVWDGEDDTRILYDGSRERSDGARERIEAAVREWESTRILEDLRTAGLTAADRDVWTIRRDNVASAEQRGREILARALPLFLLLMLAQGTFYASLDTVVGERERGTLETLLVSPLARGEVLLGKFLFVVAAAVIALTLNLASLTVFFGFLLDLMGVGDQIRVSIGPAAVGLILLTAVLTAGVLAALFMVISVPARTYREGQATLSPVYLLLMVPGLIVSFDSGAFGMNHALVPVLNSVALFKSVLSGEMPVQPIAVTLGVLAVTSAAALAFAARLAGREQVYFGNSLTLRRLLTGRRGSP